MMGKRPLNPVLHHQIKALISATINNLFFSSVSIALTPEQVFITVGGRFKVSFETSTVILSRFVCIQMIQPHV